MNPITINQSSTAKCNPLKAQNKYKEAATALFQKLNSLQQASESNKSQMHSTLINQLNQKQNKFFDIQRNKNDQYSKILKMVQNIEKEIEDQQNEQQKVQRAVESWIESAQRELNNSFDNLEKERVKSQGALQQWIDNKLESFVLKNKNAWNKISLINPEPYIEEINHSIKEHKKFLEDFGNQCHKLKKEMAASIKDIIRMTEEEVSKNDEEQIRAFLKTVHMEVTGQLKWLHDQRTKTEERVLSVLERVVESCLSKTQNRL